MGNVLVLLHLHLCDRQEATNQWKTKKLVNKPKQELQRDLWTNVSTNITNTTTCEKLRSDNGKQRIRKIALRELSTNSSTSLITRWKQKTPVWSLTNLDLLKVLFLVELALAERDSKAACKRTQHCWPTTPNIVACYMLHPFAHPVVCCWMLLRVVAQSLKTVKLLSPVQTDATLLANNSQYCWMLHVAFVCTPCCMLLDVVACCCEKFETGQTFHPTTPNISFFRDRRSVAQQCWIRLHNSSNIVGAAHAHYACFTKTSGLIPSHDALQVPTLLGVAASVCIPLPTRTQQLPTLLA